MKLRSGFCLVVAPRFHDHATWRDRLAINDGVDREGEAFFPRRDWQPITDEELALIVREDPPANGDQRLADACVGLVCIPHHIRRAWWEAAEQSESFAGDVPGYETFVGQLVEFLRFKQLPLPDHCSFEVVASRPDQSSTQLSPATGRLAGLTHSGSEGTPVAPRGRVLARINLGDEPTYVVLCNLPPADLAGADTVVPHHDLVHTFFERCRDYPLIRVRLDPGDGLWLPATGAIHDGWTHGKHEPDVTLTISASE